MCVRVCVCLCVFVSLCVWWWWGGGRPAGRQTERAREYLQEVVLAPVVRVPRPPPVPLIIYSRPPPRRCLGGFGRHGFVLFLARRARAEAVDARRKDGAVRADHLLVLAGVLGSPRIGVPPRAEGAQRKRRAWLLPEALPSVGPRPLVRLQRPVGHGFDQSCVWEDGWENGQQVRHTHARTHAHTHHFGSTSSCLKTLVKRAARGELYAGGEGRRQEGRPTPSASMDSDISLSLSLSLSL